MFRFIKKISVLLVHFEIVRKSRKIIICCYYNPKINK
ncbi:hypothetical protein LINPERPRIM_LOCUS31732 [Linum perenne]